MKTKITEKQARRVAEDLGVDLKKYSLKEFRSGLQEELEHRNVTHGNLELTGMIVMAHLKEKPDYYTRLKKAMG